MPRKLKAFSVICVGHSNEAPQPPSARRFLAGLHPLEFEVKVESKLDIKGQ